MVYEKQLKGLRHVLKKEDVGYPQALREIPDPPQTLYVIGALSALQEGLAVIGARKATPYGLNCAQKFTTIASKKGIPIISGGARGCDSAAHQAALENEGITIAILGGGCDRVYPKQNQELFQSIIDKGGAIVAEHDWDVPPMPHMFRMRNRIIAGLAKATLIVEAGLPSGTFSTADEALSASKEVLVIPGAITSPNSLGTNRLLYQGATPIVDEESFEDALFNIYGLLKQPLLDKNSAVENPLLQALYAKPLRIDEMLGLMDKTEPYSAKIQQAMLQLTELQRKGYVCAYPDGTFGPAKKAFM